MISEKLDRRLLDEIGLRRESAGIAEEPLGGFEVIIELTDDIPTPRSGSRAEKLEVMKRSAERSQAGLVAELESMGVTQFESLPLSNSISTELTVEQIARVVKRADVRRIRLRKIEKVTTAIP